MISREVGQVRRGADGRVFYPESLVVYAERYGLKNESTIRAWLQKVKKSADPDDIPPLHLPEEMPAWWDRHHKKTCPANILEAAAEARDKEAAHKKKIADLPLDEDELPLGDEEERPKALEGAFELLKAAEAGDAGDTYDRLAKREAYLYQMVEKALKAEDEKAYLSWDKMYSDAMNQRRHWEQGLAKIRKERGELVSIAQLTAEFTGLAGYLAQTIGRTLGDLIEHLVPDMSPTDRDRLQREYRDRCFTEARDSDFGLILKAVIDD